MIAMLFSAGLGTRLKPLTDSQPKALVNVLGKPLLQHNIESLKHAGIKTIVVNVHHFSEQIVQFLKEHNNFGIEIIISDESKLLLDTGGGLKKVASVLKQHNEILLHNVDILSNINYKDFIAYHQLHQGIATLAVRNRETSRYLLCDNEQKLKGWENIKSGEKIIIGDSSLDLSQKGFSGIHIISRQILNYLPNNDKFNIIQWYLKVAKDHSIHTFDHSNGYWHDIGTLNKLQEAEHSLKE